MAVFYGFQPVLRRIMHDYALAGRSAVHIDLGYWSRRFNGNRYGFHRFSINAHHPTAYFQNFRHGSQRADALGIRLKPWRAAGSHVLLCGMSEKAAGVVELGFEEFERSAIQQIKAVTERPIIYRPKANKQGHYRELRGTTLRPPSFNDIEIALNTAFCVVSHHSNAGIDAIVHGVPCFQLDGVALAMGSSDLSQIENPRVPTDAERQQWINDVAYCQFNCEEMRNGVAWRHLKAEGLV